MYLYLKLIITAYFSAIFCAQRKGDWNFGDVSRLIPVSENSLYEPCYLKSIKQYPDVSSFWIWKVKYGKIASHQVQSKDSGKIISFISKHSLLMMNLKEMTSFLDVWNQRLYCLFGDKT